MIVAKSSAGSINRPSSVVMVIPATSALLARISTPCGSGMSSPSRCVSLQMSGHLAALARIGELLDGDTDDLVLSSRHLPQVDVVHNVMLR
jgi:hypothetical protein